MTELTELRDRLEQDCTAAEIACTTAADWIRCHFERAVIHQADEETVRQLAKLAMSALAQVVEEVGMERTLMRGLVSMSQTAAEMTATMDRLTQHLQHQDDPTAAPADPPLVH